jgi:hypothetical protein
MPIDPDPNCQDRDRSLDLIIKILRLSQSNYRSTLYHIYRGYILGRYRSRL